MEKTVISPANVQEISPEKRAENIKALLAHLNKFGKGERSNKEAKAIRRKLRALGYFLSRQNSSVV